MDSLNRKTNRYGYAENSTTEYSRFKSEYFSGADVRIYFDDIWVDEITNLQFVMQEQVAPVFGYASYTWDKVARGNRYIQGSFTINFKESYYLHSVLNRLSSVMKGNASSSTSGFNVTQWTQGTTIEHLIGSGDQGKFESLADEFEKSLWGQGAIASINKATNSRSKETYFYPEFRGDDGNGGVVYDAELSQKELAEHGFNIVIEYGPRNQANGLYAQETVHTLIGVQLTGVSQVVDGSGQPVQEQYSFIAKDLDGNVTKK